MLKLNFLLVLITTITNSKHCHRLHCEGHANEIGFEEPVFYQENNIVFPNNKPIAYPERNDEIQFDRHNKPKPRPNNGNKKKNRRRICERKYVEYIQRIFPNDADIIADANDTDFNGRVLAFPGEYPHMTAIGFEMDNQDIDYKCGGSLISENFIITAAHCTNITGQSPIQVRIGDLNLKAEENNVKPQTLRIRNIYTHPNYRSSSYYNDIALLELEQDVEFTEFVRPIHLWVNETIPYTTAYAMGYGATAFGKERTNRLTDLNMTIISNAECNRVMPALPETSAGIISSQICAQDKLMNRDTCQGDSGGPLQLNVQGRRRRKRKHFYLIGITSYGLACRSGNPSVHTRISSFLDWIESIVWKNQ